MGDGWCPFAIKRPIVGSNFLVGRPGNLVKAIVLHIADGPLSAIFPTFNDPAQNSSTHFCVGKAGEIEQYVSINDTAYGNGLRWSNGRWLNPRGKPVNPSWIDLEPKVNPNLYTVSIEHEGKPDDEWTEEMYAANNHLLIWIAEQFDVTYIPHRTLIGHHELDPVDRARCPGPNAEFERIARDANNGVPLPASNLIAKTALAKSQSFHWLPINTDAALYKFSQEKSLGYPQTDEFEVNYNNDSYVAQVFNLGIVFAKKNEYGNVMWIEKPPEV